jgi:hypothetical protein
LIAASQEFKFAVGAISDDIARAVKARIRLAAEWMGRESTRSRIMLRRSNSAKTPSI